ncbi:MAG: phosphoadenosine phosphosulfate reductase family protein [Bacteroidetes bacterium]|nr:phosphoadenosine phosphosulfate reductase family protein [Bacteroidota bacterium]
MNKITPDTIDLFNANLRYESPKDIISFALELSNKPLLTTSFGSYAVALLHAVTKVQPSLQVVWCDTGYNTEATYKHVKEVTELLQLNLDIVTPKYTTAFLESMLGRPNLDNPNHQAFSEQVKLEPFQRALEVHKPDLWFANLRKGQTAYRDGLDILSFSEKGILKVSPFYHYSDRELQNYLAKYELPNEDDYFDPVKALTHRECGIHFKN